MGIEVWKKIKILDKIKTEPKKNRLMVIKNIIKIIKKERKEKA